MASKAKTAGKATGRKTRSGKSSTRSRALPKVLPPFLSDDLTRTIVERVEGAAKDAEKLTLYSGLLRRAYERTIELETLYQELPGVLAGDKASIESFRGILDTAAAQGLGSDRPFRSFEELQELASAASGMSGGGICDYSFFIPPDRISLLAGGIGRITGSDIETQRAYGQVLRGLWEHSAHLDRLTDLAQKPDRERPGDRISEYLDALGRESLQPGAPAELDEGPSNNLLPGERPSLSGIWPPPETDLPLKLPSTIGPPPGLGFNPCADLLDACRELVAGNMTNVPLPDSTNATGISSVMMVSCGGSYVRLRLNGVFPHRQPSNIDVVVGRDVAEVISWSAIQIDIRVPIDSPAACVGFRDRNIELTRQRLHGENQERWQNLSTGLKCFGEGGLPLERLPYPDGEAPCTGNNQFTEVLPLILSFLVNGSQEPTYTETVDLRLSWRVEGADTIRIRRISDDGPPLDVVDPPGRSLLLGTFGPEDGIVVEAQDATYELIAINSCGEDRQTVTVHLRVPPPIADIQILGVEWTQAIQRFDPDNPALDNSVRMVANKSTVLRVYMDPGTENAFFRDLYDVTGLVTIRRLNELGQTPLEVTVEPFNTRRRSLPNGTIVEAEGVMTLPSTGSDRSRLDTTLNFLLPHFALPAGRLELTVEAFLEGRRGESQAGVHDEVVVTPFFHRRQTLQVFRVLVRDTHVGADPPSGADFRDVMRRTTARLPIADNAIEILIPPGFEVIDVDFDFTAVEADGSANGEAWCQLLDEIDEIACEFEDHGEIWTALISDHPDYNATSGVQRSGTRYVAGKAGVNSAKIFAHEFIHTFKVKHSKCPGDTKTGDQDDRLDIARTEDWGMDIENLALVGPGTRDLMCRFHPQGQRSWPSILLWDLLFEILA